MSGHTKGEWIVEHDPLGTFDVEYQTEDGGGLICVCGTDRESEGNACLIAAAPKLLALCEQAESMLDGPIGDELSGDQCADLGLYDMCSKLKAAIAEATKL